MTRIPCTVRRFADGYLPFVTFSILQPPLYVTIDALVDTGSPFTVLSPKDALSTRLPLSRMRSGPTIGLAGCTFFRHNIGTVALHFRKEFWPQHGPRSEHIHSVRIRGDRNNNKMERLNGEIRDREKVLRGVKKKDTPILAGYQIYHNYLRPHEALDGRTPAQAAGIEVKGENKWVTLIQSATRRVRKE